MLPLSLPNPPLLIFKCADVIICFRIPSSNKQPHLQDWRKLPKKKKRLEWDYQHFWTKSPSLTCSNHLCEDRTVEIPEDVSLFIWGIGWFYWAETDLFAQLIQFEYLESKEIPHYNHLILTVYCHGLVRHLAAKDKAENMVPPELKSGQMFAPVSCAPLYMSEYNSGKFLLHQVFPETEFLL